MGINLKIKLLKTWHFTLFKNISVLNLSFNLLGLKDLYWDNLIINKFYIYLVNQIGKPILTNQKSIANDNKLE